MNKLNKRLGTLIAGCAMLIGAGFSGSASASTIIGGDAVDLASAPNVLDIVFAIDTSGSMNDDISAIGAVAQSVVQNLQCPDTDVYVRARFMGITGTSGIFNETVRDYVIGLGETPVSNHSEDNGPAVTDLANHYEWHQGLGDLTGKDLYRAVVTIGDEGTENGYSVNQADWDAAVAANQAAIANDVFLFSWVTDDPYPGVPELFQKMAEGGTAPVGYTGSCSDTGGAYVQQGSGDSAAIEATLQQIICTAGSGGTSGGNGDVPEPTSIALAGIGLLGLWGAGAQRRRRKI